MSEVLTAPGGGKLSAEISFRPLNIAVMTVSDTRSADTDTSGKLLADRIVQDGHRLAGRAQDNARARDALSELGLNPLMVEAFRDRSNVA